MCFGAQWLAQNGGGSVEASDSREYGRAHLTQIDNTDRLFAGMTAGKAVWMSHGDTIQSAGDRTRITCSTEDVKFAGFAFEDEPTWGIQFHPEVYHSEEGLTLLRNFVHDICGMLRGLDAGPLRRHDRGRAQGENWAMTGSSLA